MRDGNVKSELHVSLMFLIGAWRACSGSLLSLSTRSAHRGRSVFSAHMMLRRDSVGAFPFIDLGWRWYIFTTSEQSGYVSSPSC